MASVRGLKKDIDSLIFEVISDCFVYTGINQDDNAEKVSAIISDAVNLRNDLIARVNNPDDKDNSKIVKSYYKSVEKDLISGADKLFERLSSLKKKEK
jgi:hypothetical protein